jgi:hypothetical protein
LAYATRQLVAATRAAVSALAILTEDKKRGRR